LRAGEVIDKRLTTIHALLIKRQGSMTNIDCLWPSLPVITLYFSKNITQDQHCSTQNHSATK